MLADAFLCLDRPDRILVMSHSPLVAALGPLLGGGGGAREADCGY
jgi:hypothetical protein